jgi:hypothetical protein
MSNGNRGDSMGRAPNLPGKTGSILSPVIEKPVRVVSLHTQLCNIRAEQQMCNRPFPPRLLEALRIAWWEG